MISIIVPVYNVEKYIDRCVKSLINQSYKDIEIILIDDGSTDLSGKKCDEWEKCDSRIIVIHKENGGLSEARNTGLSVAKGEYVGFVDSDDWIDEEMYSYLINSLEKNNADVAVTGMMRAYENGYEKEQFTHERELILENEEIVKHYLMQNFFSTAACDKLYKAEIFYTRKFPKGKYYEDAPVIYNILKSIKKLVVLGKPQYYYFQRSSSICGQTFSSKNMDHYYFSKEIYLDVKKEYDDRLKKEAYVFWCCKLSELIYTLKESNNSREFNNEYKLLCKDISRVIKYGLKDNRLPIILRLKLLLIAVHSEKLYIIIKKLLLKKGE